MNDSFSEYAPPAFEQLSSPALAVAEQPDPLQSLRVKPVVVTGGAGLVGTHLCGQLAEGGWKVRAIVRDTAKATQRLGHLRIEIRAADIRDPEAMRAAMRGAGCLVHLAAIAIEKPGESYTETNTEGTSVLLAAARAEAVDRFVFMSQNGADSSSTHAFLRSKGLAQDLVEQSEARWTVLRPSVIFGPEDEFVNVLARLVRLSPLVFPLPAGGRALFQPVAVGDVARAIVKVLEEESAVGQTYAIGGSTPLTLRQMTERILIAMHARRILVGVPVSVIRPLISVAQRLLPKPPVTTELLDLLEQDNVIERNDLQETLGITPVPFAPEELLYLRKITMSSALGSLFGR